MGVSLSKGGNLSLTKEAPGLTDVLIGLGWDTRTTDGAAFDLDASAIVLNDTDKVISDKHFIFFNNLPSPDGTVEHTGDNLTGEGEGDDEQVKVNLAGMAADAEPAEAQQLMLTAAHALVIVSRAAEIAAHPEHARMAGVTLDDPIQHLVSHGVLPILQLAVQLQDGELD